MCYVRHGLRSTTLFPINLGKKKKGEKFKIAYLYFFKRTIQFFHLKKKLSSTSQQHCDNF